MLAVHEIHRRSRARGHRGSNRVCRHAVIAARIGFDHCVVARSQTGEAVAAVGCRRGCGHRVAARILQRHRHPGQRSVARAVTGGVGCHGARDRAGLHEAEVFAVFGLAGGQSEQGAVDGRAGPAGLQAVAVVVRRVVRVDGGHGCQRRGRERAARCEVGGRNENPVAADGHVGEPVEAAARRGGGKIGAANSGGLRGTVELDGHAIDAGFADVIKPIAVGIVPHEIAEGRESGGVVRVEEIVAGRRLRCREGDGDVVVVRVGRIGRAYEGGRVGLHHDIRAGRDVGERIRAARSGGDRQGVGETVGRAAIAIRVGVESDARAGQSGLAVGEITIGIGIVAHLTLDGPVVVGVDEGIEEIVAAVDGQRRGVDRNAVVIGPDGVGHAGEADGVLLDHDVGAKGEVEELVKARGIAGGQRDQLAVGRIAIAIRIGEEPHDRTGQSDVTAKAGRAPVFVDGAGNGRRGGLDASGRLRRRHGIAIGIDRKIHRRRVGGWHGRAFGPQGHADIKRRADREVTGPGDVVPEQAAGAGRVGGDRGGNEIEQGGAVRIFQRHGGQRRRAGVLHADVENDIVTFGRGTRQRADHGLGHGEGGLHDDDGLAVRRGRAAAGRDVHAVSRGIGRPGAGEVDQNIHALARG